MILTIWAMSFTKGSRWLLPDSWLELTSRATVMSPSRVLTWAYIPAPNPAVALRSHCRIGCSVAPREADSSICQCPLGVSEICDWDFWMQVTPCPWSSHHALPGSPCCVYWCFLSPWAGGSTITKADWIFHKNTNSGHRARKFCYRKRLYQHGLSYLCLWVMDFLNGHCRPFSSAHRHIPFRLPYKLDFFQN